ncbi:MAG TPA: hypothetical protein VFV58_39890 [Blastocatellia bacterium]|jgi:hypothetical protein|nr:hypothetical protein [Blastocatellia bacterium]
MEQSAIHSLFKLIAGKTLARAAWLTFVIVIPSLLNSAGAMLYPALPRAELIIAGRDADPDVKRNGRTTKCSCGGNR